MNESIDSIEQGCALLERAIGQGEEAPLFTKEELPLVIEFLETLSDPADYQENQDMPDVLLVRRLAKKLRRQLAAELHRLADLDEQQEIELGGQIQEASHSLRAMEYYQDKGRGEE